MKHAIIILAHKDIPLLCRIIRYFEKDCYVFVHLDKKARVTDIELNKILELKNVKILTRKYSVHWGGFSMLKAELYLLNLVIQNTDANYIHLLSGQDYPVKPFSVFLDFFRKNDGKNYLFFRKMSFKEVANRFFRFLPYDWVDRSMKGRNFIGKCCSLHEKLKIQRTVYDLLCPMYHGSQWFSITRSSCEFILNYTRKKPSFYKRMRFSFAPEECYINTILVHFKYKECVNMNLRYIRWLSENGNNPSNLAMEHLGGIIESGAFFARKMEHPHCDTLVSTIDKYLLKECEIKKMDTGAWICKSLNKYYVDETLTFAIAKFYKLAKLTSAIDMGCGCGLYVDILRRYHVAASGYDGNPYTPELSSLILGAEMPCAVADLTEELGCEDDIPFDLVLCIDVLPYIPKKHEKVAVNNLVNMCNKYLIISWAGNEDSILGYVNPRPNNYVVDLFIQKGLKFNLLITDYLKKSAENDLFKRSLFVFEKC